MYFAIVFYKELIAVSDDSKLVDKFIENQPESPDEFDVIVIKKKEYKKNLCKRLISCGDWVMPVNLKEVYIHVISNGDCTDSLSLLTGLHNLMKRDDISKSDRKILKKAVGVVDNIMIDDIQSTKDLCSYTFLQDQKEILDRYSYVAFDEIGW